MKSLAILGAGAWGTAVALHLSRSAQDIRLWSPETEHIEAMQDERCNRHYLAGYSFPDSLHPETDFNVVLEASRDVLIMAPSTAFSSILKQLQPYFEGASDRRLCWGTKGMDTASGQWLHELVQNFLGEDTPLAVLSGPSFAVEVADKKPTAVTIASNNAAFLTDLTERFEHDQFHIEPSEDIIGVQVCGVLKNILAVAVGICDGLALGANARSAVLTYGLSNMARFGAAVGARPETFFSLAGVGDAVLTSTSDLSRNRRFGLALGEGKTLEEATRSVGKLVESINNCKCIQQKAAALTLDLPVVDRVADVLSGKISPEDAMRSFFRHAKP